MVIVEQRDDPKSCHTCTFGLQYSMGMPNARSVAIRSRGTVRSYRCGGAQGGQILDLCISSTRK